MTKVAIVGSRNWSDPEPIRELVNLLPKSTTVVTGDARGADRIARACAKLRGLEVEVHRANWSEHGRAAGPIRNSQIAMSADFAVGFVRGESRGTRDTLRKFVALGKFAVTVDADSIPQSKIGWLGLLCPKFEAVLEGLQ